jgi:2-polyprenyl-3-methyl-5-hydroxy-6-metoxy-1,4-benzoquinol methylase
MNIYDEEFWAERLRNAQTLHHSVYLCNNDAWKEICDANKAALEKYITPDMTVLDVGCGYGRLLELYPVAKDKYLGVDLSPDFIAKAKQLWPNHGFVNAKICDTPILKERFDIAVCLSIRDMVKGRLGGDAWAEMETSISLRAKTLLILEYTDALLHGELHEF